jgi:hypothetical protein
MAMKEANRTRDPRKRSAEQNLSNCSDTNVAKKRKQVKLRKLAEEALLAGATGEGFSCTCPKILTRTLLQVLGWM